MLPRLAPHLIQIKTAVPSFEQYRCCTTREHIMDMDVMVVVASITAAFVIFAATLFWADLQTRHLGDRP